MIYGLLRTDGIWLYDAPERNKENMVGMMIVSKENINFLRKAGAEIKYEETGVIL